MPNYTVSAGQTTSGITLDVVDSETVLSGGTSIATTVNGGTLNVYAGGSDSGTTINNHGGEFDDGSTTNAVVNYGELYVGLNDASAIAIGTNLNGQLGFQYVISGSASGTIVNGGKQFVYGGSASDTVVNGGYQYVYGGSVSDTIVNGGFQNVSGGSVTGTVVNSGGIDDVFAGIDSDAVINAGGVQDVLGGVASGAVLSGGSQYVFDGGTAVGTRIGIGGLERVLPGGIASGAFIDGGILRVQANGIVSGAIVFEGTGGSYEIDDSAIPTNTIFGFGAGDTIDLAEIAYDSAGQATLTSGNVLEVVEGGSTYYINLDPNQNFAGNYFHLSSDQVRGTFITEDQTPCFCRGVMIVTAQGEVPVERLRVGDRVLTLAGEAKPITWIGQGRRRVTKVESNARPVIVRAGALADGVPKRDLRLTHGHSLYLDGMLIPVDLLINGRTILWDDAARSVEFYHVELAGHDVLIADGAPAESYREDGNRGLFENLDPPRVTTADAPWFAPVTTAGPEFNRVWRHLLERSGWVEPPATHDPDLHLLADGVRIDAIAVEGRRHRFQGVYRFRLEQRPAELSIVSRNTVPRDLGINHDRRRLGVALRSIALRGAGAEIDLEYDSAALDDGFHAPEHAARHRWTTGRAALPNASYGSFGGPFEVLIEVVCAAKYPLLGEHHAAELATAA